MQPIIFSFLKLISTSGIFLLLLLFCFHRSFPYFHSCLVSHFYIPVKPLAVFWSFIWSYTSQNSFSLCSFLFSQRPCSSHPYLDITQSSSRSQYQCCLLLAQLVPLPAKLRVSPFVCQRNLRHSSIKTCIPFVTLECACWSVYL